MTNRIITVLVCVIFIFYLATCLAAAACDSCGNECADSCGTKQFRACCFNYNILRKRSYVNSFDKDKLSSIWHKLQQLNQNSFNKIHKKTTNGLFEIANPSDSTKDNQNESAGDDRMQSSVNYLYD